ncbi:MAG TPA: ferritin-like domain-containing protein [Nevskiaceae bacterium]|nr:ferritin-like domain-containing protein [Nevskiaceae bacterium]
MKSPLRWHMADAPWQQLQPELIRDSPEWRYMICVASFVEITTDLYTRSLVGHFAGDDVVCAWLRDEWDPQEMQHGQALREYVRRVWPDFDWDSSYRDFYTEFEPLSGPDNLLPRRSLEMIGRCVVEMGTSSYYTALHRATDEPVLKWLTRHIYEDEVAHYKHFLRYFNRYREREGVTRWDVAMTLWHRLREIDSEDSYVSIKHVHAAVAPGQRFDPHVYKQIVRRCRHIASRHVPRRMAAKMLLRPLDVPPRAQRLLVPALAEVARWVA